MYKPQSEKSYMEIFQIGNMPLCGCGWHGIINSVGVYPGKAEYTHYQDNGEDFSYQEGEYNLYRFKSDEGRLSMELLQKGYRFVYKTIVVHYLGKEKTVNFEDGCTVILL